jgi:GNAT superfamily N-acetyltransferase
VGPAGHPRASDNVRAAAESDIPQLVELYEAAYGELVPARGGRVLLGLGGRPANLASSFAAQLSDPAYRVVVGSVRTLTGGPAGYGTCRTFEMTGGALLGCIEELYVKPDARRSGLGSAIAAALLQWCQACGCTGVDAKALPGSRAVKSFFEGEGFTARLLVMHRALR